MKIGIIIGSHRANSQSAKVAGYAQNALRLADSKASFYTLDLFKNPLPLWDEGVWDNTPDWKKRLDPIFAELQACEAFVVVSPEYHGMVPPALKNFFLLAGKDEIGHKPGLIIAVSSGRGGSYPVAELRMSSYKNNRINWIPEHMIVRDAEHVLNGASSGSESDTITRTRLDYCCRLLLQYGKALKLVRESGVIDYKSFPSGL